MFRVKIEDEYELIEAIAKIDLGIKEIDELNSFLAFLDEDNSFMYELETELEKIAEKKIEAWMKKKYKKWKMLGR